MAAMAVSWCTDAAAPKIFLTFDKFDRQVMGRGIFGTYGGHNNGNALTLMKGHLKWSTRGFQRPTRDGSIQGQALQDPSSPGQSQSCFGTSWIKIPLSPATSCHLRGLRGWSWLVQ